MMRAMGTNTAFMKNTKTVNAMHHCRHKLRRFDICSKEEHIISIAPQFRVKSRLGGRCFRVFQPENYVFPVDGSSSFVKNGTCSQEILSLFASETDIASILLA